MESGLMSVLNEEGIKVENMTSQPTDVGNGDNIHEVETLCRPIHGDVEGKETPKANEFCDHAKNETAGGGLINMDFEIPETFNGNVVVETKPHINEGLTSVGSQQDAIGGKTVCKRGRPRKKPVGSSRYDRSQGRDDSNEGDCQRTVEPVKCTISSVTRSGRQQKRVLEKPDDWNEKEIESLKVWFQDDENAYVPVSTTHFRKNKKTRSKRKVGVRGDKEAGSNLLRGKGNPVKTKDNSAKIKKTFQCKQCDRIIHNENDFKTHLLECGGTECPDVPAAASKALGSNLACPVCQVKFTRFNGVKKHMSVQHTNLVHVKCALCSKEIGDIHNNIEHFHTEHQLPCSKRKEDLTPGCSQCPECGLVLTQHRGMTLHFVNVHSNLLRITCALCRRPVGTMLEYLQHFVQFHSHSSASQDIEKEMVTTNTGKILKKMLNMKTNEARCEWAPPEESDPVCKQCNKSCQSYKLLALHILSHKIDENTNVVSQRSINPAMPTTDSNPDPNPLSSATTATGSTNEEMGPSYSANCNIGSSVSVNREMEPSTEHPFPVWWVPPDTLEVLPNSVSASLGPDLVSSINRSLNIMADMVTHLASLLHWKDEDYVTYKEQLITRLNKVLHFSSGIADIGKCLLLVLEETGQFKGNPYIDNVDIFNEFDEKYVEGEYNLKSANCENEMTTVIDVFEEGNPAFYSESEMETTVDKLEDNPHHNDGEQNCAVTKVQSNASNESVETSENVALEREQSTVSDSNKLVANRIPALDSQRMVTEDDQDSDDCSDGQSREKIEMKDVVSESINDIPEVSTKLNKCISRRLAAKSSASYASSGLTTRKKGQKKFVCRKCGKHLTKKSSLVSHMLVHSLARPFKCKKCPATFKAEDHLKRHLLTHLKDEQYKCDFCDFSHRSLHAVQRHSYGEHPQSPSFSCDICKHQARTSHDLTVHIRIHQPKKCNMCEFEATSKAELTRHERKSHADKSCPNCSYRCMSNYQLNRHLKTHYVRTELDKVYCCEICGATFDTNRKLRYHVLRHTNRTPYACALCDYKCSSEQSYNAHVLKHSGVRPYKCSLCDASFYQSSHVKQHMRRHSDEKEFCCRYCGKGFKYRYNCQEHEMIHTGEKKFKCTYCSYACRRRKILEQHMASHKGQAPDMEALFGNEDVC